MPTLDSPVTPFFCELAGVAVEVVAPARLRGRIEDLYGHVRVAEPASARLRVEVSERSEAPARPAHPAIRLVGNPEIWGEESADGLVLSNGHASISVHYDEGAANVWMHTDHDATSAIVLHQLLPIAIAELLRTRNVFAIHAASIVRDGRALLLLGDSGAGKSTLAWRSVSLGWRVLADDGVLLVPANGTVRAYPFYREFSVDPELADPHLVRRSVRTWKGDRSKMDLPPSLTAESAEVVAVALLNKSADACTVKECSKTEVLAELVHQSPFLFVRAGMAASHTATLRTLTQSCATTKLDMTTQVLRDDRLAGELLASAFGSTRDEKGAARA